MMKDLGIVINCGMSLRHINLVASMAWSPLILNGQEM